MEILYESPRLIVCIKPPGVSSQSGPGPSVPSLLAEQSGLEVFPVHRLDRPVGGVMAYAKTSGAAAFLSDAIRQGAFQKEYIAILKGAPPMAAGRLEDLLYHDPRRNKTYVVARKRRGVREAALEFETLASGDGLTLVRVRLLTGRTHQIRAQFAARGAPLLGDGPYGGGSGPTALWCRSLRFPDPDGGAALCFVRPPAGPPWDRFPAELL